MNNEKLSIGVSNMAVPICRGNQFLNIGDYLARRRNTVGLKQRELAALARVKVRYVRSIEQGKTPNPKVRHLARLLQKMGYELMIVPIGAEDAPVVSFQELESLE
jgi:transcriptional regulator with XRE-family HTH domain